MCRYNTYDVPFDIDSLPLKNCKQVIIVSIQNESDFKGRIDTYETGITGSWKHLKTYQCVVGQNGVSENRHEGEPVTPEGIYGFLFAFGSAENPGLKMEYRQTDPYDYWSSAAEREYNTWVRYTGDAPDEYFYGSGNYEALYSEPLYKYAAALDFNYYNKVTGKGSAIFFHIAPYSGSGTGGCIALDENGLLQILKCMDPDKDPKICIGTSKYFKSLSQLL